MIHRVSMRCSGAQDRSISDRTRRSTYPLSEESTIDGGSCGTGVDTYAMHLWERGLPEDSSVRVLSAGAAFRQGSATAPEGQNRSFSGLTMRSA